MGEGQVVVSWPHRLVSSTADGWFVCSCGCGLVAVCRHCVPNAHVSVPEYPCWKVEQERLVEESRKQKGLPFVL